MDESGRHGGRQNHPVFFDALTIAAARDEMLAALVPGRVQQVRAVSPLAVSLEIYGGHRRRYLLLSAHAEHARAHLLSTAPTRDPSIRSPLLLLLRKYLRGAVLQSIDQPNFERVLDFAFTKVLPVARHGATQYEAPDELEEDDDTEELDPATDRIAEIPPGFALFETHLVAEIMGRHSNLVLVGEGGIILDAVKHIPSSINRYRTTLPHQSYVPPPAQRKLDLRTMGELSFEHELTSLDPAVILWQALVARFRAVSPLLAREAVYRATGNADALVRDAAPIPVFAALGGILGLAGTGNWSPNVAWAAGGREQDDQPEPDDTQDASVREQDEALAFAPYPLTHLETGGARLEPAATISSAAESFYAGVEVVAGHAQLKAEVRAELQERRTRLERRRRALQAELDRAAGFEKERHKGEMILAYMYGLQPGQTRLEVPDENLVIELDPARTPLEQAQALFREYQRARAAVENVPARLESVELGLRYLDELATHLDLAPDHDTIQLLRAELSATPDDAVIRPPAAAPPPQPRRLPARGRGRPNKPKPERAVSRDSRLARTPGKTVSRDGFTVFYGRSAQQNDAVTFGLAAPEDIWLHARNVPGAHVVVRTGGRPVPESTVAEAARLAARQSKARTDTAVDVIITEKRHVRRVPGGPPGLVTVGHERVLRVRPEADAGTEPPDKAD